MFRVVATLTVCAIALAGCEQPQPIIPGKREAVDTLIQDAPARAEIVNKSVAFRAPSMSTNANWPKDTEPHAPGPPIPHWAQIHS